MVLLLCWVVRRQSDVGHVDPAAGAAAAEDLDLDLDLLGPRQVAKGLV